MKRLILVVLVLSSYLPVGSSAAFGLESMQLSSGQYEEKPVQPFNNLVKSIS